MCVCVCVRLVRLVCRASFIVRYGGVRACVGRVVGQEHAATLFWREWGSQGPAAICFYRAAPQHDAQQVRRLSSPPVLAPFPRQWNTHSPHVAWASDHSASYDVNCSPDKRQIMLHAIDPILEQLRTVLLRLYPAQAAPGFAASEAFASYAASPTKVKVTLVNPTTRATTQVSLAQLAGTPRFTDHSAAAGLDTTTDDGEPDEPSSLGEHREGAIDDDDTEPPTQTYGHQPPANSTPSGIQCAPAAQAHEREHEASFEHHQGGGEEEEEEEGEEAHTQVYGTGGGGASGGGALSRQPEFGGGHALVSPRFRSPVMAAQPAAAAAASYPRVAPAPTRVASLDTGAALSPGGADLSPYTSFLASIDPVRAAQLPPPAAAKRKLDQPPHNSRHHHHADDDDENEAEDEPRGDIRVPPRLLFPSIAARESPRTPV